jgi:proteic killer suppression protein
MEITYANSRIQKICTNNKVAQKVLGKENTRILKQRLKQMKGAQNLEELRFLPGTWHELAGDRKGQLACSLSGLTRLIFMPDNIPRPIKSDGGLDWSKVTAVKNLEIVDYH